MKAALRDNGPWRVLVVLAGAITLGGITWQYRVSPASEAYCIADEDCDRKAWDDILWPLAVRCRGGAAEAYAAAAMIRLYQADMKLYPPKGDELRTQLDACLARSPET